MNNTKMSDEKYQFSEIDKNEEKRGLFGTVFSREKVERQLNQKTNIKFDRLKKLLLIVIICCLALSVFLIVKQLTIKDRVDSLSTYINKTEAEEVEEEKLKITEQTSTITTSTTLNNTTEVDINEANEICAQNKEVGPCRGYFPRFYYDMSTGQCNQFIYGGCRGNKNNFEKYSECKKMCEEEDEENPELSEQKAQTSTTTKLSTNTTTKRDTTKVDINKAKKICTQNKKVGPCRGAFPRYYYDVSKGKCLQFIFGGCHRNKNNFQKYEECQRMCEIGLTEG